jgi:low temperature requirement protein LtrA
VLWEGASRVAFAFGVTTTFCLWWMYFNDFKAQMLRQTAHVSHLWLYGHLPLHLFHALLGMLMATTLEYTEGEPLPSPLPELALGTAALVFFSSGFLTYVNSTEDRGPCTHPHPRALAYDGH